MWPPVLRMKQEVTAAADFLVFLLITWRRPTLSPKLQHRFKCELVRQMLCRYRNHWFPQHCCRGTGYRCIRINGNLAPLIQKAGLETGLSEQFLLENLPDELTVWVDPGQVVYRLGPRGLLCWHYGSQADSCHPMDAMDFRTPVSISKYL